MLFGDYEFGIIYILNLYIKIKLKKQPSHLYNKKCFNHASIYINITLSKSNLSMRIEIRDNPGTPV